MGWPLGKARKPKSWSEKTGTEKPRTKKSWTEKVGEQSEAPQTNTLSWRAKARAETAEWRDESSDNLFSLPQHVHDWLNGQGLVAQWNTESVLGQPVESLVPVGDMRKFWEPVQEGDVPNFKGVERGGLRLYVRPKELQQKAELHQQQEAKNRIRDREQSLLSGNLGGVTLDPRHPSARRHNHVRHSYERVEVPRDE